MIMYAVQPEKIMLQVNTTEFRRHLFEYLNDLDKHPLELTRGGQVVAQVVPVKDHREEARQRLAKLRKTAKIMGDLTEPLNLQWTHDDENLTWYPRANLWCFSTWKIK